MELYLRFIYFCLLLLLLFRIAKLEKMAVGGYE